MGDGSELTADKLSLNLWLQINCICLESLSLYSVFGKSNSLRKGSNCQNKALQMTGPGDTEKGKGKGKGGKRMAFPILQVGGDPYSSTLSFYMPSQLFRVRMSYVYICLPT